MKYLSVVVPCYNVEKYLDKCLSSFSDDRISNSLEVLIVNDGSKDNTPRIAQEYVNKYPEIFKLINKENGGHGTAINTGILNATGKYFRIVDGDDWVNTDDLVKLLDYMKNIDSDLIVDQKTEVNMTTGKKTFCPTPNIVEFNKQYNFLDIYRDDLAIYYGLPTISIKLDILKEKKILLPEKTFYVDYVYILKATAFSKTVTFLDLDVYMYLLGNVNQSVNSQNYVRLYDNHTRVTKECLEFAVSENFSGKLKDYIDKKLQLLLETHINIALIYNKNRKEGYIMGKEFFEFLKKDFPYYYRMLKKRYIEARVLHTLGFNFDRLQRLKAITKHN